MKIGKTDYKVTLKPDLTGLLVFSIAGVAAGALAGAFTGLRVQAKRELSRGSELLRNANF